MPGVDNEDIYESDSSDNDENHSRLLNSISQLDSTQRVKPAQRNEVASEVSEYNLSRGDPTRINLINVKELAQALGKKSKHVVISKNFKNVTEKAKTLPKPLEKPVEDRLKRSIGFDNVKKQLQRWDAIVTRNALNDHISFPLNDTSMKMQKSNEFLSQFKSTTPLEEEMAKVLKTEDTKKTEEEEESENIEFPLTLEEMLEKRKEMAQLRAKLSYKQSKAQRQSKIKSKKYHRILKREKIKQQLKEFEMLQKTDPEAALKKLAELDKTRVQERASLRHRNTGQWARNLTVRAKYDVETRKVLAEQLKVSRELTQKVSQMDSSDDEEAEEEGEGKSHPEISLTAPPPAPTSTDNPWTLDVSKEVQDFISGYKKFWTETNKKAEENKSHEKTTVQISGDDTEKSVLVEPEKIVREDKKHEKPPEKKSPPPKKREKISPKKPKTSVNICPTSGVWIVEAVTDEPNPQKERKRKAQDIDNLFEELNDKLLKKAVKKAKRIKRNLKKTDENKMAEENHKSDEEIDLSMKNIKSNQRPDMDVGLLEGEAEDTEIGNIPVVNTSESVNTETPAIDPKNFIQIKPKRLRTYLPENVTGDEDALDDEKAQQKMMEEAFGDDDVMEEFKKMKREEEEKEKIVIQNSLPGWGKWGGSGIIEKPNRKKRLLVFNRSARKDKKKTDIIINENENPNLKNHLVKDVPHPFTSVEAFEANIRAPLGRDWVPETAHQKLIQKPVVTKLGAVIEPMSENEIIRLKKASKSPYQGKKKEKK